METRWNDGRFIARLESLVWMASPIVRRYLHILVSGQPECDWLTYARWRHLPPTADRALVLGCGSGWLERSLVGHFRSVVACDFAPDTVEQARCAAKEKGLDSIEYRVLDLEHGELGGPYDAIFANDVLHHITGLENLYARIHEALGPEGKFVFCEYVGPNRFQYPDERMDLVNSYFRLLPDELRRDAYSGELLRYRTRLDPVQLVKDDPTEAVRSEDVLPLARQFFEVETEYPYGGGLLNPLLYGVIVNFDEDNRSHNHLLQVLCDAEDRLIRAEQLEPDFFIFVGRRKPISVSVK
jgi:SAM-dependent methyltransferase